MCIRNLEGSQIITRGRLVKRFTGRRRLNGLCYNDISTLPSYHNRYSTFLWRPAERRHLSRLGNRAIARPPAAFQLRSQAAPDVFSWQEDLSTSTSAEEWNDHKSSQLDTHLGNRCSKWRISDRIILVGKVVGSIHCNWTIDYSEYEEIRCYYLKVFKHISIGTTHHLHELLGELEWRWFEAEVFRRRWENKTEINVDDMAFAIEKNVAWRKQKSISSI